MNIQSSPRGAAYHMNMGEEEGGDHNQRRKNVRMAPGSMPAGFVPHTNAATDNNTNGMDLIHGTSRQHRRRRYPHNITDQDGSLFGGENTNRGKQQQQQQQYLNKNTMPSLMSLIPPIPAQAQANNGSNNRPPSRYGIIDHERPFFAAPKNNPRPDNENDDDDDGGENNDYDNYSSTGDYDEEGLFNFGTLLYNNSRSTTGNMRQSLQSILGATMVFGLLTIGWMRGYGLTTIPQTLLESSLDLAASTIPGFSRLTSSSSGDTSGLVDGVAVSEEEDESILLQQRPEFVYEHPYVSSSYYSSTKSIKTLVANEEVQVRRNLERAAEEEASGVTREIKTSLAIVRPFCEFDAEALPTTFTCWNALPPCKAASADIGGADYDEEEEYEMGLSGELVAYKNTTAGRKLLVKSENDGRDRHSFDLVGSDAMKNAKADVFLFYSQTFSENDVAIKAVDTIIDQFFEPGGWSQCFGNIYAIEANIPQELDLYIPSAQEELYNWVNGPNRQFEAAFRIIQSGEWGEYDGFYLMEGDSVPIKAHWLDVVLSEIEVNRPFAILGAQYDGDKWDNFYEKIPISLLHHTNGNAIYNTSHPLLERLVGQLEVEAPCPYNSIPYDYRMSQMWVEGTLRIVPELAPKIMLNEEGENITLSNNVDMFNKWADIWEREDPFKYTPVIHNYAATNLIPRHLGPEYIIHGAKLYSPWNPTKTDVTLVVSEWFFDRSLHLIQNLDEKDHPFSEVVVMVPPVAGAHDDYDQFSDVLVRTQHRGAPDFMDLCEADVKTDWFMITNSYHHVARHVDLMFTPGSFKPVIPFTPATYPFCFKFPYCKETINLAQRINPGHDKVVLDMDMLYNTKARNAFCKEWKEANGEEGEDLYQHQQRRLMFRKKIIGPPGPTGTSYFAWLVREKKDGMYKMTDRSLYGARPPFVKIFSKEEKLDGMSEDELAKRVGMTLLDNSTDCNCGAFETDLDCAASGIGCIWRPLFESCHPPELVDGGEPICSTTEAPTMSPTLPLPLGDSESPTVAIDSSSEQEPDTKIDPWYTGMFKVREHDSLTTESNSTEESSLMEDDDAILEPDATGRKLKTDALGSLYETDLSADQRLDASDGLTAGRKLQSDSLDSQYETDLNAKHHLYASDEARTQLELKQIDDQKEALNQVDLFLKEAIKEAHLPTKICDTWVPSVVPRYPTASNTWNGSSLDLESRSFAAMATSRPRKLHGSLLQYHLLMSQDASPDSRNQQPALSGIIEKSSPLKDSWVTSAVPLNLPKYAIYQEGTLTLGAGLDTPGVDHKTLVNYGDGDNYEPIRITFSTNNLLDNGSHHKPPIDNEERSRLVTAEHLETIETLTGDIFPAISEIWAGALSVLRSVDNTVFPLSNQDKCGEANIPQHHLKNGVSNTDTLIYISVNGPLCYSEERPQDIVSHATVCSFDQDMRPISANIDVCLDNIDASFGEVSEVENLRLTSTLTIEVGKVLGLSPSLFQHFRSSETGQPFGSTEKEVTCVDGTERTLLVPNVLQSSSDLEFDADDENDSPYFQVTTPTVKQIIRNHFDCQTLLGARLIQGESDSCFGDSFDPRYHFDEDLTSIGGSADMAYSLSPLTLALLQDSGWYQANFQKSTAPLFGRGAGCGFVEGDCIGESVPEYSQGFFCSDITEESQDLEPFSQPSGCDYTYNHKADCSAFGEDESMDDVCPMRIANIKSCSDVTNMPSLAGETYSLNSRCFVTDTPTSVCLESYCNSIDAKIDIVVNGMVYQCDYEGQELDLGPYIVHCPRPAVVCPHLVCPSNCSGKGVCDYCLEKPHCVCDDPFDESPGCYGDMAESLDEDDPNEALESEMETLTDLIDASKINEAALYDEEYEVSDLLKEERQNRAKLQGLLSQKANRLTEVLKPSVAKILSKLMQEEVENERELQEEDAEISRLRGEEMHYKAMIDSEEVHKPDVAKKLTELELLDEDEELSRLHNEVLKYKAAIGNDNVQNKPAISNLLSKFMQKKMENERELLAEDEEIARLNGEGMEYGKEEEQNTQLDKEMENENELQEEDEESSRLHNEGTQNNAQIAMLKARLREMKEKKAALEKEIKNQQSTY